MGLSAALYTGLSGLDVNQTQMNVVGNNIANVNTIAFKSSRALFSPQFYVTDQAGSPPDANFGGTDPSQSGLGAQVATIQKNFTQGTIQPTGQNTDMAINGEGFFVTQSSTKGQQFTRDGSFALNANHELVSTGGAFVQGFGVDGSGNIIQGQLQNITIPLGSATISRPTSKASLTGNLSADGVVAGGQSVLDTQDITLAGGAGTPDANSLLTDLVTASTGLPNFTSGQVLKFSPQRNGSDLTPTTFTVTATSTVGDLQTFFNNSLGIDTTVAGAGTQIVAGAAPNSVDLQVVGNSGAANALTVTAAAFTDTAGDTPLTFSTDPANNPTGESTTTAMTVYDSLGSPVQLNLTSVLTSRSNAGTSWKFYVTSPDNVNPANPGDTLVGTGTLTFDPSGQLLGTTGSNLTIYRSGTGALPVLPVALDFSGVSALAEDAGHAGSEIAMSSQDGIQIGTLTSFSVGGDGVITGTYDNGQTRSLGQVALATFSNPAGLNDEGDNNYQAAADSGVAVISTPDRLGGGQIQADALEQSNVDLSREFTNMIVASTGFSAASRVITTSNQMLTDLLNTSH